MALPLRSRSMDGVASELTKTELFKNLTDDEIQKIAGVARSGHIQSGQTLIEEADISNNIYLILEGRVDVKVYIPGSGDNEIIATLKEGDVVGELALLGRSRRTAKVTARDDVRALVWDKDHLTQLFSTNQTIGYKVMINLASLLADRLSATNIALRNVLTAPRTIFL